MDKDHSVVVDAVLCYVSNYRKAVPDQDLCAIIPQYCSDASIADSFELLRQQTASLLTAGNDDDAEGFSITGDSSIESILRIFQLCDLYRITLPKFAAIDLRSLPPPPPLPNNENNEIDAPIIRDTDLPVTTRLDTSAPSSINGLVLTDKMPSDALFTHQILLKIVQELQQLKSLVLNLSQTNHATAANTTSNEEGDDRGASTPQPEEEPKSDHRSLSRDAANDSTLSLANVPGVDDHNPPSRDSSVSLPRTATVTPPRKRGSSRRSSSIENAVAMIKAQKCSSENLSINIDSPNLKTEAAESVTSGTPTSQKSGVDDTACGVITQSRSASMDYCEDTNIKNDDTALFPSIAASQANDGTMHELPLFLRSVIPGINSASPPLMGVCPVASNNLVAAAASLTAAGGRCDTLQALEQSKQPLLPPTIEQPFAVPSGTPSNSPAPDKDQRRELHKNVLLSPPERIPSEAIREEEGLERSKKASKRQAAADTDCFAAKRSRRQDRNDSECSATETGCISDNGNGGDKPYECTHDNCRKRFGNKFLLKKHEFIHTGLRPYQCPYCLQRCNRKDNLLRHKLTHEKNYSKPRRRSCRVFGVKSIDGSQSDAPAASSALSPSSDLANTDTPQRSLSCAPSECPSANRQSSVIPTAVHHSPPPASLLQQNALQPSTNLSLAILASFMARSLCPGSGLG